MLYDIPSRLPPFAKIGVGWLNKLLDSIRRRTVIAGDGIRTKHTPNGVVVSVEQRLSSTPRRDIAPWKVERSGEGFRVYIPEGAFAVHVKRPMRNDISISPNESENSIANEAVDGYDGWYSIGEHPSLSDSIVAAVRDNGHIEVGFLGYMSAEYIAYFPVAHAPKSGKITQIAYGSFLIDIAIPPRYGTEMTLAPDNATSISQAIANMSGGGGGGLDASPSDAVPKVDEGDGDAGSNKAYSRGDHSHPLNVNDEELPEPIDGSITESDSGTSPSYARADHVHGAEFMANSPNSEVTADDLLPDGGTNGEASVGGSDKAAPIDHSHPLNVDETGEEVGTEIIPEVSEDAEPSMDYGGESTFYARADHTHPLFGFAPLADTSKSGITDALMLKDGSGSGEDSGKVGFDSTNPQDVFLAAPIGHSHPLNVPASTDEPEDIVFDGSVGVAKTYARSDHAHAFPSDGNNSTGIGADVAPTGTSTTDDVSGDKYGTGYNSSWTRQSDNENGFTIPIMVGMKYVNNVPTVFFRNMKIDRYGMVRGISSVTYGRGIYL